MPANDDDQALMLQSFTEGQLSYDQAVRLLQTSNNDLNIAANKFFDQGFKALEETTGFNLDAFSADRYGQPDPTNSNIPSFNIYPHSGTASVAPSRPPTRNSHRSGASPAHAGDTPMQSIERGQESGLIGNSSSGPVFGPANRDTTYEEKDWGLVPISASTNYLPDAAPTQRKREEDGPAIIKPLTSEEYLPALITILHSVPLYRNALLAPEIVLTNYKVGDDWWKGRASTQARIVDYGSNREAAQDLEILHETQRLMAFLDNTDRAYGSVGGLQQLDAWKEPRGPIERVGDELLKFLINWGSAYQNQTAKPLNGVLRSMVQAGGQNEECFLLDATVVREDPTSEPTLYDVLDDNLFFPAVGKAHIVDISNVVILRLENSRADATGLDCKFPPIFYADRYLEENKPVIDQMFQEMAQYQGQLKDLDAKVSKLKYHTTKKVRPGEQVETLKLLKSSMVAFQPKEDDLIEDPKNATVLSRLRAVYENIERKLNVLEEQKRMTRETIDSIAARFRAPFDDKFEEAMSTAEEGDITQQQQPPPQHPHTHPYKLCGASTRPGVYYLQHPDIRSNVPNANQWWRIEYSTAAGSEAHILRERLSLDSVLDKLHTEYKSALVIYANDAATSPSPLPLTEPLLQFVKADNVKFLAELQEATGDWYNDMQQPQSVEPLGGWDKEPIEPITNNSVPRSHMDDWRDYGTGASAYGNEFQDDEPQDALSLHHPHNLQDDDDPNLSSTTLTPNTEIEEGDTIDVATQGIRHSIGGVINSATHMTGTSAASSVTMEGEAMDIVDSQQKQAQTQPQLANVSDVEMMDVGLHDDTRRKEGEPEISSPEIQHIEVVEKKDA